MDCIFCKIANGEIPTNKVYEDDDIVAFYDLEPQAPVHILIIPKNHITSANDITCKNSNIVAHIFEAIPQITAKLNIGESGYRVINNCGENGGQTVKHMHFHLLGGRSMEWPPG